MAETDIDKRFDIHEIAKNKQAELDRFQCSIYCCHSTGCKSSGSDDLIDLIKQAIVDHGIEDKVRLACFWQFHECQISCQYQSRP